MGACSTRPDFVVVFLSRRSPGLELGTSEAESPFLAFPLDGLLTSVAFLSVRGTGLNNPGSSSGSKPRQFVPVRDFSVSCVNILVKESLMGANEVAGC